MVGSLITSERECQGILEECSEARSLLHRLKKDMQGDRKREENLFKSMFRA